MAYYKQSFDEAQGNTLSLDAYRDRKAELKKAHGDIIFTIQAKYEKRKRILHGQIAELNKAMFAEIKDEMERFKAEKTELAKLLPQNQSVSQSINQ